MHVSLRDLQQPLGQHVPGAGLYISKTSVAFRPFRLHLLFAPCCVLKAVCSCICARRRRHLQLLLMQTCSAVLQTMCSCCWGCCGLSLRAVTISMCATVPCRHSVRLCGPVLTGYRWAVVCDSGIGMHRDSNNVLHHQDAQGADTVLH
jgi:hypothetical protein